LIAFWAGEDRTRSTSCRHETHDIRCISSYVTSTSGKQTPAASSRREFFIEQFVLADFEGLLRSADLPAAPLSQELPKAQSNDYSQRRLFLPPLFPDSARGYNIKCLSTYSISTAACFGKGRGMLICRRECSGNAMKKMGRQVRYSIGPAGVERTAPKAEKNE
jgi:hypothetical protein